MIDYHKEFEIYLVEKKKVSSNTHESYMRDIGQFLHHLSLKDISNIMHLTGHVIREYIASVEAMGKSRSTATRMLASIRCFCQYLDSYGHIESNPAAGIKLVKAEKKLPNILSGREIDLLLSQPNFSDVKGMRDKAMLEILYATGIRVSELIALDVQDLNLGVGILHCRNSKVERVVPIYPEAVKAIERYVLKARSVMVIGPGETALFTNTSGTRLTRQGFWKIVKFYTKQAGIEKDITPHTLRHSFATHMLENGAQLKDIQELLGHADISSTQVYAHIMKDKYANVYKKYHPRAAK